MFIDCEPVLQANTCCPVDSHTAQVTSRALAALAVRSSFSQGEWSVILRHRKFAISLILFHARTWELHLSNTACACHVLEIGQATNEMLAYWSAIELALQFRERP